MKKICFIAPNIYPLIAGEPSGYGGAEVEIYNLSKILAGTGDFSVEVFCRQGNTGPQKIFSQGVIINRCLASRKGLGFKFFWGLISVALKSDFDIYFSCLATVHAFLFFCVAKLRGRNFVHRVVSDWETKRSDFNKLWLPRYSWIIGICFVFFLKHVDIVFVSKSEQRKRLVLNFGLAEEKIIVVSNLIEWPEIKKNPQNILWINRIEPFKRPEFFLQLAQHFPEEKFVMIGPVAANQENYLSIIKSQGSSISNLDFLSGVPRDQVWKYYGLAKIFVLTSEAEGQSNVLVESLKTGTPVVSLYVDPDGILMKNQIGFCANGDFGQMVRFVQNMLADSDLWQQYSQRALAYAKVNFDSAAIGQIYSRILFRL